MLNDSLVTSPCAKYVGISFIYQYILHIDEVLLVVMLSEIANVIPQKTIERIFSTEKEISSGTLYERSVI